jgi:hypothetical protein
MSAFFMMIKLLGEGEQTALGCKMEMKEVENCRKKKKGNRMGWEAFIQFQARLGKGITRKQRDQLTWCSA